MIKLASTLLARYPTYGIRKLEHQVVNAAETHI